MSDAAMIELSGLSSCPANQWLAALLVAAACVPLPGCGATRPARTEQQIEALREQDAQEFRETWKATIERLVDHVAARSADNSSEPASLPPTFDVLALSGGGANGAFGAGVLVGWGQTADLAHRRPDFAAVTGVSTGSLLAPFAFLGTDSDCAAVEQLYSNPKPDWVEPRGLLFFMPWDESFERIPGLERDIRAAVDAETVRRIADRAAEGRALGIAATNLDLGTQRVWLLGTEAVRAQQTGDNQRIADLMLASSAIPAAFPPREIDGFLYVDGGVTANILLRLNYHEPDGFFQTWLRKYPDRPLPRIRYWVVINAQLHEAPQTTQPRWPAITAATVGTAVRAATWSDVELLVAHANYYNQAIGGHAEVRLIAIPDEWRAPVKGEFALETMRSLAELGRRLGADPGSWRVLASPEFREITQSRK
jgi:hypothetical protein